MSKERVGTLTVDDMLEIVLSAAKDSLVAQGVLPGAVVLFRGHLPPLALPFQYESDEQMGTLRDAISELIAKLKPDGAITIVEAYGKSATKEEFERLKQENLPIDDDPGASRCILAVAEGKGFASTSILIPISTNEAGVIAFGEPRKMGGVVDGFMFTEAFAMLEADGATLQ